MGFRDTFTKEEQDDVLGYDDAAFYYFASSVLMTLALPWTYYFLKGLIFKSGSDEDNRGKKKHGSIVRVCKTAAMVEKAADQDAKEASRRSCNFCWWLQLVTLGIIWASIYYVMCHMGEEEVRSFDPFRILEVESGASTSVIKKAYHKLSLVYHPDKNPDDPLASARFIQITKAYQAMTDPVAKSNYEKYGNPDGPQTSKVGIGLPRFLLEKENHVMILLSFFGLLIFVIPMVAICYYQRTKNYAGNGVLIETLQFVDYCINEGTRQKHFTEILAASAESRQMATRAEDNEAMKVISQQVVEHKKREWPNHPIIMRNNFLLLAHLQRMHDLMTPALKKDCDQLLKYSTRITQAMIECACHREWFHTASAVIEFRRCLIQAVDIKGSQLLQVPHFNEEVIKAASRGKNFSSSLSSFISRAAEDRKGVSKMNPQQIVDIDAFVNHVSDMNVEVKVVVEDEDEICIGDIATVSVAMTRKNLRPKEAAGPVHAPMFPQAMYEEWWIFLVDPSSNKIVAFERVRDTDRYVESSLRFQVTKAGKRRFEVHCLCDSYIGIDRKVDANFVVLKDDEASRKIFIHKDDEDLDLQPTLFQQMMGDFGQMEESDDEEDVPAQKGQKDARENARKACKDNTPESNGDDKEDEDDSDSSAEEDSDCSPAGSVDSD